MFSGNFSFIYLIWKLFIFTWIFFLNLEKTLLKGNMTWSEMHNKQTKLKNLSAFTISFFIHYLRVSSIIIAQRCVQNINSRRWLQYICLMSVVRISVWLVIWWFSISPSPDCFKMYGYCKKNSYFDHCCQERVSYM